MYSTLKTVGITYPKELELVSISELPLSEKEKYLSRYKNLKTSPVTTYLGPMINDRLYEPLRKFGLFLLKNYAEEDISISYSIKNIASIGERTLDVPTNYMLKYLSQKLTNNLIFTTIQNQRSGNTWLPYHCTKEGELITTIDLESKLQESILSHVPEIKTIYATMHDEPDSLPSNFEKIIKEDVSMGFKGLFEPQRVIDNVVSLIRCKPSNRLSHLIDDIRIQSIILKINQSDDPRTLISLQRTLSK